MPSSPPRPRVSPQFREFERFTTAGHERLHRAEGAQLRRAGSTRRCATPGSTPICTSWRSNGGVATPAMVAEKPVLTLLSGPAAGVLGGAWAGGALRAAASSSPSTSAAPAPTSASSSTAASARRRRATPGSPAIPCIVPMIDIHTIGAGGGSIAYVDQGGAFRVGPRERRRRAGPGRLRPRRHASRP